MKYVMAEHKADSTGTRVMASACISLFHQAVVAKICKITKHLLLKIAFDIYASLLCQSYVQENSLDCNHGRVPALFSSSATQPDVGRLRLGIALIIYVTY